MSRPTPTLDPSPRRAMQVARIEALRGETPVSRYAQRLIEPSAWAWFVLTFLSASLMMAGLATVDPYLPGAVSMVVTGVGLYLSVVLVDALFAPAPSSRSGAGVTNDPSPAFAARRAAWAIRIALAVLVLSAGTLTAFIVGAPEAPVLERFAVYLEKKRADIEHRWQAAGEPAVVHGRTRGTNWQLLERDGRYVAASLNEAKQLCAGLGAGWQTPTLADFSRLEPTPDEPSTLHVWVGGAGKHASTAQIVAGSWQPTGFLSSTDTARDRFQVLCVTSQG